MKGKAICVSPARQVATSRLQSLLDAVLPPKDSLQTPVPDDSKTAVSGALDAVQNMLQVRKHLLAALAGGNNSCGGRFRLLSMPVQILLSNEVDVNCYLALAVDAGKQSSGANGRSSLLSALIILPKTAAFQRSWQVIDSYFAVNVTSS